MKAEIMVTEDKARKVAFEVLKRVREKLGY